MFYYLNWLSMQQRMHHQHYSTNPSSMVMPLNGPEVRGQLRSFRETGIDLASENICMPESLAILSDHFSLRMKKIYGRAILLVQSAHSASEEKRTPRSATAAAIENPQRTTIQCSRLQSKLYLIIAKNIVSIFFQVHVLGLICQEIQRSR